MNTLSPTLRLTHLWFVLMGVCFPSYLMAQQLVGYVTEQNSGRKPVADVQIKATGANPITSAAKGQFILTFQSYDVGEVVVVRPEKTGWE